MSTGSAYKHSTTNDDGDVLETVAEDLRPPDRPVDTTGIVEAIMLFLVIANRFSLDAAEAFWLEAVGSDKMSDMMLGQLIDDMDDSGILVGPDGGAAKISCSIHHSGKEKSHGLNCTIHQF